MAELDPNRVAILKLGLELGIPASDLVAWAQAAEAYLMPAAEKPARQRRKSNWSPERRAAAAERMRAIVTGTYVKTVPATAVAVAPTPSPRPAPAPAPAPVKDPRAAAINDFIATKGVTKVPPRYAETEPSKYRV